LDECVYELVPDEYIILNNRKQGDQCIIKNIIISSLGKEIHLFCSAYVLCINIIDIPHSVCCCIYLSTRMIRLIIRLFVTMSSVYISFYHYLE